MSEAELNPVDLYFAFDVANESQQTFNTEADLHNADHVQGVMLKLEPIHYVYQRLCPNWRTFVMPRALFQLFRPLWRSRTRFIA